MLASPPETATRGRDAPNQLLQLRRRRFIPGEGPPRRRCVPVCLRRGLYESRDSRVLRDDVRLIHRSTSGRFHVAEHPFANILPRCHPRTSTDASIVGHRRHADPRRHRAAARRLRRPARRPRRHRPLLATSGRRGRAPGGRSTSWRGSSAVDEFSLGRHPGLRCRGTQPTTAMTIAKTTKPTMPTTRPATNRDTPDLLTGRTGADARGFRHSREAPAPVPCPLQLRESVAACR